MHETFLHDLFLIFVGSIQSLHKFFDELNSIHPTLKLTMTHTTPHKESKYDEPSCKCEPIKTIPYLDTQCQIKEGKIITDLYRKPRDRNQYLLHSSCHPTEVKESIPYSLSLRIVRTCMEAGNT